MTLKERLNIALSNDNSILIPKSDLDKPDFKHTGFSTEYMGYLGLKQSDLKKLERSGVAIRTYTKNTWYPGEKLPNGKEVKPKEWFNGKGHRTRWLLVSPDSAIEMEKTDEIN